MSTTDLNLKFEELQQEIATLLQSSAEQNDANALLLNQQMQRHLYQIRQRLQSLLSTVRKRYAINEMTLVRRQKARPYASKMNAITSEIISQSGAVLRGGTFNFKGNLYFRDLDGRSCPNNEDYESRCNTEMFPTDFDMRSRHVWTMLDKKNLVMGVKEQLLEHFKYDPNLKTKYKEQRIIDLHGRTLASLLKNVDSGFTIDWNQISTLNVEFRHSAYSCEAMWLVYLHPDVKRDDWTSEEDDALVAAAKANKMQNWQAIAAAVTHRSDYQCYVRMQTALRHLGPMSSGKWTEEDDERLCKLALQNTVNGIVNWGQVTYHFPERSKSTIIGRYIYALHPKISHEPFTPKEDVMLFAAFAEYNGKFSCFPRHLFPNRSLPQLRTRYNNVLAQRTKTDSWSIADDTKLMSFVTEHGTSQWLKCADHLGNHTRTSCRTRFLVIKRFMEQNPNANVSDIPRRKSNKSATITAENWEKRLLEWQEDPEASDLELPPKRAKCDPVENNSYQLDNSLFEYLRYAYNLDLQEPTPPIALPRNQSNLQLVAHALQYAPSVIEGISSVCLSETLRNCYSTMLPKLDRCNYNEDALTVLLPPSWSTMMGLRALCILSVYNRKTTKSSCRTKYDPSLPALQLFRRRLRTLLFNSLLLSRLDTKGFTQLPAALEAANSVKPTLHQATETMNQVQQTEHNLKSEPVEPNIKEEIFFE